MNLVIVESPTKARTIQRFLSDDFIVKSSLGHVRDLPQKELGIDIKNNFKPKYIIPTNVKKKISELKKATQDAKKIILATDEDREGEAIAWHLTQALSLKKPNSKIQKQVERIAFHEITKRAIHEALNNPRGINMNLVDAQQARRILDRLVGYKLSPFLWKKIFRGLSAGRVQSAAVRLVADREKEIENFKPEEYWEIIATLKKINPPVDGENREFEAKLVKIDNNVIQKLGIKKQTEAKKIIKDLKSAKYRISEIICQETKKNPAAPFTTSTLQQEAAKKFGYSAKQTMILAQQLYEGVELGKEGSIGLITYMRTDSLNLSQESISAINKYICQNIGSNYAFSKYYKTKSKRAQEAHEAIRPTDVNHTPESIKQYLDNKQFRLYDLIWKRTIASQMYPAIFDQIIINISAKNYTFKAQGLTLKFDGFLKIYGRKIAEIELPSFEKNELLELIKLIPFQHFTQSPSRYTEATLIKVLEKNGIGRPSTYAPIIDIIQERNYIQKNEEKKLKPTETGILVNNILVKHFPNIVDLQFTAKMETDLDKIAEGKIKWVPVIKNFYLPFEKNLIRKTKEVSKKKLTEATDRICPKCKGKIVIKLGRYGKFYACSNFPTCHFTENIINGIGIKCIKCQIGEIIEKKTKKRKIFYGCSNYPKCDFALWDKPTGKKCPQCQSLIVKTKWGEKCSKDKTHNL